MTWRDWFLMVAACLGIVVVLEIITRTFELGGNQRGWLDVIGIAGDVDALTVHLHRLGVEVYPELASSDDRLRVGPVVLHWCNLPNSHSVNHRQTDSFGPSGITLIS